MKRAMTSKVFSAFVSIALVAAFAFPATALAEQRDVQVENHTTAGPQTVSGLSIDGVDAPIAGKPLDDKAVVSSAEGATWDIPVLWIGSDLQLTTVAVEARAYLPVLVFFVPQDYAVEGNSFTVSLSESLQKLFGNESVISIFDSRTNVTYILPVSLRDFFTHATNEADVASGQGTGISSGSDGSVIPEQDESDDVEGMDDGDNYPSRSNIEIWCADTARDVLTDDDLDFFIDLILNKLEPQAVNLLIESFPSFKSAASQNQIGKNIGLYIYYKKGDKDGVPEHGFNIDALAYVASSAVKIDGEIKYSYIIGVDVDDLLLKIDDEPAISAKTGKFAIDRTGEGIITFNNTIVHEMFHAFMDDYNRPGMIGAKSAVDAYMPNNKWASDAQRGMYNTLRYPTWFIEGTASSVENVYQFRYDILRQFRAKKGSCTVFEDTYTLDTLLYNYLNAEDSDHEPIGLDLAYSMSSDVDTTASCYATGYLATLFLSQLAVQKDPGIGSAVNKQNEFSSEKLRLGLDSILKRMHEGETLDQVIADISAIDGAAPLYANTNDFEKKFIKGVEDEDELYHSDYASIQFTLDFLNYMLTVENTPGRIHKPNGSILFDFDQDFNIPLDDTKTSTSDCFCIITSNRYVPSTASDSAAFAGGGKSDPSIVLGQTNPTAAAMDDAELPLAAKAESKPAVESSEPDSDSIEALSVEP